MSLMKVDQLLKPEVLAKYLGVSRATVLNWREKYGMPYVKVGDTILIPEPQFLEWIERVALRNTGGNQLRRTPERV